MPNELGFNSGVVSDKAVDQFSYAVPTSGVAKGVSGVKPSDVIIDREKLSVEQRKQLDELIKATKTPLTPLEVLQNQVKALEQRLTYLEQRVQSLEFLRTYEGKLKKDWDHLNDPLTPRYIEPQTGTVPVTDKPYTIIMNMNSEC